MEFGSEARIMRAAQNLITEQSGLSRLAIKFTYSDVSAFQVISNKYMLKHIQYCTNMKPRRVFGNKGWEVSLGELIVFIALPYVQRTFPG